MGLFKDMLKGDETIFKDEIALDLDFIPSPIKFRENEQQHIATCIKPLAQNRNGKNNAIWSNSWYRYIGVVLWRPDHDIFWS